MELNDIEKKLVEKMSSEQRKNKLRFFTREYVAFFIIGTFFFFAFLFWQGVKVFNRTPGNAFLKSAARREFDAEAIKIYLIVAVCCWALYFIIYLVYGKIRERDT